MNFISNVLNRTIDEVVQFFKARHFKQNIITILAISFPIYFMEYLFGMTQEGYSLMTYTKSLLVAVFFNYLGFLLTFTVVTYLIKQNRVLKNESESPCTVNRKPDFDINDLIDYLRKNLIRVAVETTKCLLLAFAGFLILIIPGIYISIKLCLAPYIAQDESKEMQSNVMGHSFNLTSGHFWAILLLMALLLFAPWFGHLLLSFIPGINIILYPLFSVIQTSITAFLIINMYEILKTKAKKSEGCELDF